MSTRRPLRAYLVDDIETANLRLAQVLTETGRVEVVGSTTQPRLALAQIPERDVDVVFLDIEMPGVDGFDVLERLGERPRVIFVTGYEQYARRAFDERAVDYLMKPVTRERVVQALDALEGPRGRATEGPEGSPMRRSPVQYAERVSVELGQGGMDLIEVSAISHFVARGKATLAMTAEGERLVNHSLGELENRLDPRKFARIHRNVVVNLDWVQRVEPPRGGGLVIKLRDKAGTELEVARERVRGLKERFVL